MNPIIVNNESYFQFTMSAIACPLPPQLHFHLYRITDEKGHKRGGYAGMQAQKGMVCLQIGRLSPSINQRIAPT